MKAGQQNTSTPTGHDWSQYLGDGSERGRTARSEAGDAEEDQDFIVIWLDQGRIREELAWERRPSSMRVWVTQEDLWVYHALLRAIANTNKAKGADRFANAAIRGIEALQVGQPAGVQSRSQGKILAFEAEAQPSMDGETGEQFDEGMAGEDRAFDEGSAYDAEQGGGDSSDGKSSDAALLSQRYLDAQGRPLAGGPSAGVEFKRLPVRMVLFMDQRWLTHFLAECANAPLPVEVQEVHINPQGQGGGSRYSGGDFSGSRGGTGQLQVDLFERNPNLVRVVIQGIVYIYNKPNLDILQGCGRELRSPSHFYAHARA